MRTVQMYHDMFGHVGECIPEKILKESLLAAQTIRGHAYALSYMVIQWPEELQEETVSACYVVCIDHGDLHAFHGVKQAVQYLLDVMREHNTVTA